MEMQMKKKASRDLMSGLLDNAIKAYIDWKKTKTKTKTKNKEDISFKGFIDWLQSQ